MVRPVDKPRRRRPILGRVAYPTPRPSGARRRPGERIAHRIGCAPVFWPWSMAGSRRQVSIWLPPGSVPPSRPLSRSAREAPIVSPDARAVPGDIHTLSPAIDDSCGPPASLGSHCSAQTAGPRPQKRARHGSRSEDNHLFSPRFMPYRPPSSVHHWTRGRCALTRASRIDARVPSATPADSSPPFRHCLIVALRRITAVSGLARSDP